VFSSWLEHGPLSRSAALAYYTLFSVGPLLLLAVALSGFLLGPAAARGDLAAQLAGWVGRDTASAIQLLVAGANKPRHNVIASVISIVAILFGATGVFAELKRSLDEIWSAPVRSANLRSQIVGRLGLLLLVILIGALLVVSVGITALVAAAGQWVTRRLAIPTALFAVLSLLSSFLVLAILITVLFRFLPNAPVRGRDAWVGAVLTSGLLCLGREGFGLYLSRTGLSSAYGAAGSILIVLLWAYYSSLVLFLGAEVTVERGKGQLGGSSPGRR
jgi:membrane protein